ncbi:MAG TPA: FtsW/RodA/SpoVE family cell cycle protein [Planctomycetota bacterium]|jgi:rod shape determining protein RodA|nr:rod shape-determining protein RodA [Planctomycetota bacterium]OQC22179.1 MAG: Rod shape-determining protein RodA [Planctomycetes bacterium ADurb.Bin069]HNR99743.1 FtsW/RodA/SpoVE family cell cycle protein [Planctomycetota bacterium]HNU25362.1 FtsW/RodA/SpoVE family cell cycle protein [Planctomycetota bacterium]HOE29369.1 FtsW/RodA/SpoVE family cell cycle protein [Planctomycetota bacterium]
MTAEASRRLTRLFALGTPLYSAAALLAVYVLLVLFGIVFVHATSAADEIFPTADDLRHLMRVACGAGCLALSLAIHWRQYERWGYAIYLAALVGLAAVLVAGVEVRAARRWFDLGLLRFQVSEFAKIALVLALARYLKATREKESLRTCAWALALTVAPALLIAREPDLGSSLMLPPVFFAMLFSMGGRVRHIAGIILIGVLAIPVLFEVGLTDYQKRRLIGFVSRDAAELDPDSVVQSERSIEAIAAGGILGKGLGQGDRQLPIRKSDFIFAVVGEEAGFAGGALLIGLCALLFFFSLEIAARANDLFARLVSVGLGTAMFIQAFTNIAVAMGILPVTGVNLPLVSQGGSSLLTTSLGIGALINIAVRPTRSLARPSVPLGKGVPGPLGGGPRIGQ